MSYWAQWCHFPRAFPQTVPLLSSLTNYIPVAELHLLLHFVLLYMCFLLLHFLFLLLCLLLLDMFFCLLILLLFWLLLLCMLLCLLVYMCLNQIHLFGLCPNLRLLHNYSFGLLRLSNFHSLHLGFDILFLLFVNMRLLLLFHLLLVLRLHLALWMYMGYLLNYLLLNQSILSNCRYIGLLDLVMLLVL